MKKLFILILSALAIAGMSASCSKPAGGNNNQGGKDGGEGEEVVDNLIAIDGVFDDWKALKEGDYAVAEVPDDELQYPCLLKMMAVGDKSNLYLYFEYQPADEQTASPITIEIDSDDDPDTGFTDYHWKDAGWDYAIESSAGFISATAYKKMNDFSLLKPMEGQDGQARSWDPKNYSTSSAKGVKNRGVKEGDIFTFEINIPRSLIKAEKKGLVRVAAYVENQEWQENGILPIEDGLSMTEMMEIYLP